MFELPNLPLLFTFLLFIFIAVKMLKKIPNPKPKLPPGPPKLPFIGNLHQMGGGLPNIVLTNLSKKYGPLMYLKLGQVPNVIVSSAKMAEEVLKTHEIVFAQRPTSLALEIMSYNFSSMAFSPYNEYWKQLRKLSATELLSAKRVQSFRSVRETEGWGFIDYVASTKGESFNISKKIFELFNTIIFKAASGRNCKDQDEFIDVLHEAIRLAGGFDFHDQFPSLRILSSLSGTRAALERLHVRMDKILMGIVDDHKAEREDGDSTEEDVLDVLLKYHESGDSEFHLTLDNIKAIVLDIFSAGSETQATNIEWAMSELMRNPCVMKKAQSELRETLKGKRKIQEEDVERLPYLKAIVKEVLRLHPPTPLIPRESRERCEINGYEIPAKTKVLINTWAISRDPNYWPEPNSFKPERFLDATYNFYGTSTEYIPFGAGRRICPGIAFAVVNIEYILAQLLYHFDWNLPNGMKPDELDMDEVFGASTKRKNDLHLIATSVF